MASSNADLLGGLGSAGGSLLGYWLGQGNRDKATQDYQDAINAYKGLNPNVTAQTAQAANAAPSAYNSLQVDPSTRASQMGALSQLKSVYAAGGMDPQARSDIAQQQAGANQNAQQLNNQVKTSMAQRGLANSGANFAAMRSNAQNAGNNANLAGQAALASGEQRAMGALGQSAALAGQVHGQDYQQASDRAGANDAISKFNAQNQTQNNQYNAGTNLRGQEDTFNNSLGQAGGLAGGYGAQAANYTGQAQKTQEMGQGVGQAAGAAAGGAADQGEDLYKSFAGSGGSGGGGASGLSSMFA